MLHTSLRIASLYRSKLHANNLRFALIEPRRPATTLPFSSSSRDFAASTATPSISIKTDATPTSHCCKAHRQPTQRHFSESAAAPHPETVSITYVEADGTEKQVDAEIGMNLMEVAHANNVELEGACGGELACSTCHLIFPKEVYDTLPPMEDDEIDMLDLAFEVTETSRLGCQIKVREDFAGLKVRIPNDGF